MSGARLAMAWRDCCARAACALALTCSPLLACAHTESGLAGRQLGGLLAGLQHPVSGLDHVLAMVAVGLWGAQLGAPAIWLLPLTFPVVMACGGALGLMGVPLPFAEIGIALSALALGLAIVSTWRPPLWAAALVVGFFAIFHGHAHGTELPVGASGLLYSLGFVAATGALHAAGIGIGVIQRWLPGQAALRLAGAAVAAAGAGFLWRAVA
jgi:urease accessory protein